MTVPGVLSPEAVARTRAFLIDRFDSQPRAEVTPREGRAIETFYNFEDMAPCWRAC